MATARSQDQVAADFLAAAGAPNTADNRKAVIAWFRQESGSTIIGNNPANITKGLATSLPVKPVGYRTSSKGYVFAVYGSLDDGLRATAAALAINDKRGFGTAGSALKQGNAVGFLNALANSAWSGSSHYGLGAAKTGTNKLLSVFKSVGGSTGSFTSVGTAAQATSGGLQGQYGDKFTALLTSLGISTDPAHQITTDEATRIVQSFPSFFGAGSRPTVASFEGKTVGGTTATLQSSGETIAAAPATLAGFVLSGLLGFLALLGGGVLVLFGGYIIVSGGRTPKIPKLPVPAIPAP